MATPSQWTFTCVHKGDEKLIKLHKTDEIARDNL